MLKLNIKRIIIVFVLVCVVLPFLSGCQARRTLLFLNWGEYINDDLVELFEDEYNCNLIVDIADSNELFYAKIKSGTTAYDLVCPAEYMVEKMYINNLLQPIDFSKLESINPDGNKTNKECFDEFQQMIMPGVKDVEDYLNDDMYKLSQALDFEYDHEGDEINYYHMPYFWGTFGLMYNKRNAVFKDVATYDNDGKFVSDEPDGDPDILQKDNNAWKVYFFDSSLSAEDSLPTSTRVGAYDSVRFFYGAAMTYYAGDPNVSVNDNLNAFKDIISRRKYTIWAGDELKHRIFSDNLDIAFNYTGDCIDMVYLYIQDSIEEGDFKAFEDVPFYTYTPVVTPAHVDTLVIPANARHVDLAHAFMDFLLTKEYSWYNNRDIGYCPILKSVYEMIVNEESPAKDHPCYIEEDEGELWWKKQWSTTIQNTFPVVDFENGDYTPLKSGIPFSYFENSDIKKLTNTVNNVKAG